jgi:predicted HicB family RNase H-like nuclease
MSLDGRRSVILRLDPVLHKRLRMYAIQHDLTLNALFVQLAENHLKRVEKKAS